jgi:hypothetical protein
VAGVPVLAGDFAGYLGLVIAAAVAVMNLR